MHARNLFVLAVATTAGTAAAQSQFMPLQGRTGGSFLPAVTTHASFAIGDLDNDGDSDVVGGGTTQVYLRNGNSWTLPAGNLPTPGRLLLVDIDGDNDRDLFSVPRSGSAPGVLVAFQNQGGALSSLALTTIGAASLQGAAIGDVDGDGDADLVVAPVPGAQPIQPLQLHRNGGNRTFAFDAPAIPANAPTNAFPVLLDYDSDGDLDVAASSIGAGYLLLANDGTGRFTDARSQLPPMRAGHLFTAVGDFDGDLRPDTASVWFNGDVDVLWRNATNFTFQAGVATGGNVQRLEVLDVDGDGRDDLLLQTATSIELLRAAGSRQFVHSGLFSGATPAGLGVGDLDGNGAEDVVAGFAAGVAVRVGWGGPSGIITDPAIDRALQSPTGALNYRQCPIAGDVDGDGRADLLLPNTGGLVVQHGRGDGTWSATRSPALATTTSLVQRPQLADVDGDGDQDLLLSTTAGFDIWRNDGTGTFTSMFQSTRPGLGGAPAIGDVDGDGDLDLVRMVTDGLLLFRNPGNGAFGTGTALRSVFNHCCVVMLDIDRDGDLDLATDIRTATGTLLLRNNGTGSFAEFPTWSADLGPLPLAVAGGDADGDGDADLVVADFAIGLRLLANDGAGVFTPMPGALPPIVCNGEALVFEDLDADGDRDLVALIGAGSDSVRVLVNDGAGTFTDATSARWAMPPLPTAEYAAALVAADADGDGDLEILRGGAGNGDQGIAWNHTRQLSSSVRPALGGAIDLLLWSLPGSGGSGVMVVLASIGNRPAPLLLAGIAGNYELSTPTLASLAVLPTNATGSVALTLPIPPLPLLVGLPVSTQGLFVPTTGLPGFTNALLETILP
ncbi:MAG: VCBS repeat-containing protein [Planctomycetes bacterium]|nr:VCBS repeat-containing protein [Planctomycetota bacterium]